eukprot:scaffold361707_cov24-Attheya_sp.AAC.1
MTSVSEAGTATILAKLCQQMAMMQQVPLFQIYLDLRKAYDTWDRERCLEIVEAYGTGKRVVRLLNPLPARHPKR